MNIKKAIIKVFSANFLQLISSLIVGFFVPAILSISEYANLKTYTLYIAYIGCLHFGYVDGLYLKYGGKSYLNIDMKTLKGEHLFTVIMETVLTLLFILIGFVSKNLVIILFAISLVPINMNMFFKEVFQATGEFNKYTKIINIYTIIYTLLNILFALILRVENYIFYCLATFGSHLIVLLLLEIKFLRETKGIKAELPKDILHVMKVGIFILLGNLSVAILFGIDKWFVKLFLSTEDFAYYSFAVSMLNIINVLVSAISITFYNYLFTSNSPEKINTLKKHLLSLGAFSSLGFFALKWIVNHFIQKYNPSLDIIAITFSAFPYMILINALYVNLYKVNKNEKKYLKVVISMLIISIIYNAIGLWIFRNTTAIAGATILTLFTWMVYSSIDLKNIQHDWETLIYAIVMTTSFIMISHLLNWITGAIVYLTVFALITYWYNKQIYIEIINLVKNMYQRIRRSSNNEEN